MLLDIAEPSAVNSEIVACSTLGFATRFTEGIPLSQVKTVVTASLATEASIRISYFVYAWTLERVLGSTSQPAQSVLRFIDIVSYPLNYVPY